MFKRLPLDNFPDDFDSLAYRNYKPQFRRGVWLWLRENGTRLLWVGMMLLAIGLGFVGALLLLPSQATVIVITAQPSPTPLGDIQGDFPAVIQQISITLPAKIDDLMTSGEQRGYRFFVSPQLTWIIRVIPDATFDPVLTLYYPDGTVAQLNNDRSEGDRTSEIIFQATETAQYGILVAGANGTSGGYTLQILPVPPQ